MVVAVIAVGMMKVIANEVVDMVAVGHGLVPAARAVNMPGFMAFPGMNRCTRIRIGRTDVNHMLVDMVAVRVMEMTVVKIVDMVAVTDRRVAAAGAVLMVVSAGMLVLAVAHGHLHDVLGLFSN